MITKKIGLTLVLFSAQIAVSAEPDKKERKIRAHIQQMHSICTQTCSEKDKNCLDTCYREYIDQYDNFLMRKAIGKCSKGFSERFSFKTGVDGQFHDLFKTSEAMDELRYDDVRACTEKRLGQHQALMNKLAYGDKVDLNQ